MISAFATPVYKFSVKDNFKTPILKGDLLDVILAEEKDKTDTEAYSLKGKTGWHSASDLCQRDTEWSAELKQLALEMTNEFIIGCGGHPVTEAGCDIKCWAMVMRAGDYSAVHTHPGTDFCGCYYVQVPDDLPLNEGNIVFVDPRGGAKGSKIFNSQMLHIKPEEGTGVVFPNWLEHYVQCHYTDGVRISVAWNLTLKEAA